MILRAFRRPALPQVPQQQRAAIPTQFLSHAFCNFQPGRPTYVHPLSDAALIELQNIAPEWFDPGNISWHPREGTFRINFALNLSHGKEHNDSDDNSGRGVVQTLYDKERRTHFLVVQYGELQGRVSLSDNSKSAWQNNIGDDFARVPATIRELCTRIDDASRGLLPSSEDATPVDPRPEPPPIYPFPDNVRPPEG